MAIARALAPAPKVLLCDEPTSALDPELALEVVAVLKQLAAEGTTMLMATRDLRLAANIARRVVFLEAGANRRERDGTRHLHAAQSGADSRICLHSDSSGTDGLGNLIAGSILALFFLMP